MKMTGEFSYDTYDGLDDELSQAYTRREMSAVSADRRTKIADALDAGGAYGLRPEVRQWMLEELDQSIAAWARYSNDSTSTIDAFDLDPTILLQEPELVAKLERLHAIREDVAVRGIRTAQGELLADTLHIVLVPWGTFRKHYPSPPHFRAWFSELRQQIGGRQFRLDFHLQLDQSFQYNMLLYRYSEPNLGRYTPFGYLEHKTKTDGDWGMMLAQTSVLPGVAGYSGLTVDQITENGRRPFLIAGHDAGNLGVFEALAYELQCTPRAEDAAGNCVWLANRVSIGQDEYVDNGEYPFPSSITFGSRRSATGLVVYRVDPAKGNLGDQIRPAFF